MLGHLTEHLQRPKGVAAFATAAVLLFGGLSLAGPVGKAQALIYENDAITVDTDHPGFLVTIKEQPESDGLSLLHAFCQEDKTGDGTTGSAMDRSLCVLDTIRSHCPEYEARYPFHWWPPDKAMVGDYLCTEATESDEWEDINGAMGDVAGGNECLAVHLGSTESGPFNWTSRDISEDECAA
jgi:hypothetical protein